MSNNSSEWKRRRTGLAKRGGRVAEASQLLERLEERRLLSGALPPTVAIHADLYEVPPEDRPLTLSATVNDPDRDPSDGPLSYAWDLDGDGEFDDASVESPVLTWADLQGLGYGLGVTRTISLRVIDAAGAAGVDTAQLTIIEKAEVRGELIVDEGGAYSISLHYFGLDPVVQWQIDWGDFSLPQTVGGDQTHATHVYRDNNMPADEPYVIFATAVLSRDGGNFFLDAFPIAVTVNNVAPTASIPALPVGDAYEGGVPALTIIPLEPGDDRVSVTWVIFNGDAPPLSGSGAVLPSLSAEGLYEIRVTATDDDGGSSTSTFMLNVLNKPPVANDDPVRGVAGEVIGGNVLINDTDQGGDNLTVRLVSEPIPGLVLNSDGTFTYASQEGPGATITFTYVASDGVDESNVATVTITVASSNRAPAGGPDSYSPNEDQVFGGNVLDNDTDADGDTLVVTLVSGPSHGRLTLNADGTFTYTPDPNFFGVDGFDYYAADPSGATTGHVHVTLTVLSVPDAPVISVPPVATDEDEPVTVSVGVSDVENDVRTISVVSGPLHGTLEETGAGVWVYRPGLNYHGTDEFVVEVTDWAELKTRATVRVEVRSVNDLPQFGAPVPIVLNEDGSETGYLPVGDVDGDAIQVLRVEPGLGSVEMGPDGRFIYTAPMNYSGPDSFHVWVTDASGIEVAGEVFIQVNPVNDAPVAKPTSLTLAEDTASSGKVSGQDVDGDALTFSLVSGPAHGTVVFNADGTFTYTPEANYHGLDSFTFKASDGTVHSDAAAVSIKVTQLADDPREVALRSDGVLVVNGSEWNDLITASVSSSGWLKVFFSSVEYKDAFDPQVVKRVVVYGHGGNDEIRIASSVGDPVWIYGDEGDDVLELGSLGGIAFGGAGRDRLMGGGGRDILIGGEGADDLIGAGEGDILIAAVTKYDDRFACSEHEEAWYAIRSEWNSARTASQRISNIRNGGGLNGDYILSVEPTGQTVFADELLGSHDTLSGRGGADWYFFEAGEDKATGSGTSDLL